MSDTSPPPLRQLIASLTALVAQYAPTNPLSSSAPTPETDAAAGAAFASQALAIMLQMQHWLVRELGPAAWREGLRVPDYTLGSTDLTTTRHALTLILAHLLSQSKLYLASLSERRAGDPSLPLPLPGGGAGGSEGMAHTIYSLLFLLLPAPTPPSPPSASSSTRPTPPRTRPLPATTLAYLITPHLPRILLAALLLGYTPSLPPTTFAALRAHTLHTLSALTPAVALSGLSGAVALTRARPSSTTTTSTSNPSSSHSWTHPWPPYIPQTASRLMSRQLLRPGGVRGLLSNLLPSDTDAPALAHAADIGEAVQQVVQLLVRVPEGVEVGKYVRVVYGEAIAVFAQGQGQEQDQAQGGEGEAVQPQTQTQSKAKATQAPAPRAWKRAAAEVVVRLWLGGGAAQNEWEELVRPLVGADEDNTARPSNAELGASASSTNTSDSADTIPASSPPSFLRAHILLLLLGTLQHAPPHPAFTCSAISPLLPALMATYLRAVPPGVPGPGGVVVRVSDARLCAEADLARDVILLWTDVVETVQGAETLLGAVFECLAPQPQPQLQPQSQSGASHPHRDRGETVRVNNANVSLDLLIPSEHPLYSTGLTLEEEARAAAQRADAEPLRPHHEGDSARYSSKSKSIVDLVHGIDRREFSEALRAAVGVGMMPRAGAGAMGPGPGTGTGMGAVLIRILLRMELETAAQRREAEAEEGGD